MRSLLGHHLNLHPGAITILNSETGKPYQSHDPSLKFNLTHTSDLFALVISREGEVGVDMESYRQRRQLSWLIESICTADEQQQLASVPTERQLPFFYKFWMLKEATLKADGRGLALPMNSLSWNETLSPVCWNDDLGLSEQWRWWFIPYENYGCAVALKS